MGPIPTKYDFRINNTNHYKNYLLVKKLDSQVVFAIRNRPCNYES